MKDWSVICDEYKGQWIALQDDEQTVIASDKNLKKALALSAAKGNDNPIVFRVPDEIIDFVEYTYGG